MTETKKMSVKEFRALGYLQELNRTFLHPLGLALEVKVDEETGDEIFGEVWDSRDDPEGIVFGMKDSDEERIQRFKIHAKYVDTEREKRVKVRKEGLGFVIEPIDP